MNEATEGRMRKMTWPQSDFVFAIWKRDDHSLPSRKFFQKSQKNIGIIVYPESYKEYQLSITPI